MYDSYAQSMTFFIFESEHDATHDQPDFLKLNTALTRKFLYF